jgi:hypothetical protein
LPPGAPGIAYFAEHGGGWPLIVQYVPIIYNDPSLRPAYNRLMVRTHLFLKVEIEHDESEDPQKIGEEIARHVNKLYVVRSVELSSVVTQPE